MLKESKQLREERANLIHQSREILETAQKEKRELTEEENKKYDTILDDIEKRNSAIERAERSAKLTALETEHIEKKAEENEKSNDEQRSEDDKVNEAFANYLRHGMTGLVRMHPEQADILQKRAQSVGTDTAGGFLVPNEFSEKLEIALKAYGGVRQVATVINTSTGQTFEYPTVDSTALTGEWIAENAAVGEQDETFGETTLSSYIASSKVVKVSRNLMNDSFFDMDGYLTRALAERIGRLTNTAYTTGNGSSKPTGITHGAGIGKTSASSTAITFDELLDLWGSIDDAYEANAKWMFKKSTLKAISQLKDSNNQYLWQPSNQVGAPDMLLGYEYVINEDMDAIGAGNRSVLFGDMSKYIIRDVQGFTLLRLEELYAANLQIGFIGFLRTDGKTVDASGGAFKCLRQPST